MYATQFIGEEANTWMLQNSFLLILNRRRKVRTLFIEELKNEKKMPVGIQIRRVKYLNNIVEQDHQFIKKRVRSMLGFKSFRTATYILSGIEAMHMIKKKQLHQGVKSVQNQKDFIDKLFGIAS